MPCDGCDKLTVSEASMLIGKRVRTTDFLFVPFENTELLHGTNVEDTDGLIPRSARNIVPIRRPGKSLDSVLMIMAAAWM